MIKWLFLILPFILVSLAGFGQASTISAKSVNASQQLLIKGKKVTGYPLTVLSFGAIGDGVHDDAPAFQAAANSGDYVVVPTPSNFYKLSSTVTLTVPGTYIKGSGKNCFIRSDTTVFSTFTLGYNTSNITVEGLSIKNQDTALTTTKGTVFRLQLDTAFAGDTTKYIHDINIINNYITGPYGATRGVFVISHRNGFGGPIWNINISGNTFENIGGAGCEVLGEYNKVWCWNVNFTDNVIRHTGLVNTSDGFGVSISGADKVYIGRNHFTDFKIIGSECTVCSFSSIVDNRYDSSYTGSLSPYTFNMTGVGVVNLGRDNSAINNKVLDSVPDAPYIVNQTNFKSTGNTIRYYASYMRIDSVTNSNFSEDTYVKTGLNSFPVLAIRLHSSGIVFSQCNIVGNSSNDQIILMTSGSKHNSFISCKISGNSSTGNLINNSDPSADDNVVINAYSTKIGSTSINVNGSVVVTPFYYQTTDSNGINSVTPYLSYSSGSYSTTFTNTANIAVSTVNSASYSRIGNKVHVMVSGVITASALNTLSTLTFTLPFSTSLSNGSYLGSGNIAPNGGGFPFVAGLVSVNTSTTGIFNFYMTGSTTSSPFSFSFDYNL